MIRNPSYPILASAGECNLRGERWSSSANEDNTNNAWNVNFNNGNANNNNEDNDNQIRCVR